MTGAIISEYYYKSTEGTTLRHFAITGSFFFIEPDVAITTYTNLCEERSVLGSVYVEDYLYFGADCDLLNNDNNLGDLINCLWFDREWLREKPEKNITEIHFGKAVSRKFFQQSANSVHKGMAIIGEGYCGNQFIQPRENDNMEFLQISRLQEEAFSLFRAPAEINEIIEEECFEAGKFIISDIPIIYTSLYPVITMVGGPILEFETNKVVGILSHESEDPFEKAGMRAISLV
jgi:hypothetical protein